MDELLTPEQVAEHMQVTPKTVRQWLRTGDLIGIKVGKGWRIHQNDIGRLVCEQLLTARMEKAKRMYPSHDWKRGQCRECGELMPEPESVGGTHWVCSSACRDSHDAKAAAIVGWGTEEFASCSATVIPPY